MTYLINSTTKLKVYDISKEIANATDLCGPNETQCDSEPLKQDMQLRAILNLPVAQRMTSKVSCLRPETAVWVAVRVGAAREPRRAGSAVRAWAGSRTNGQTPVTSGVFCAVVGVRLLVQHAQNAREKLHPRPASVPFNRR